MADFKEILENSDLLEKIIECSMYFRRIKRFRRFFPDKQIHCITFEELTPNPAETLEKLFQFANIKGDPERLLTSSEGQKKLPHINQAGSKQRAFIEPPELSRKFRAKLFKHFKRDSKKFLKYINKPADYWSKSIPLS